MKAVTIILCSLLAGCVSRREVVVVPPIHVTVDVYSAQRPQAENPIVAGLAKSVFGPETAIGQMTFGCVYFYSQNGRWPRTKEEVAAGLTGPSVSPAKLTHLEELKLREDGSSLIIDYISTENGRVQGTITLSPNNA